MQTSIPQPELAQERGRTDGARIVQDFCPMPHSLEWRLSRAYWATRGVLPFMRLESPSTINNDGRASERAAAVLFAWCEQAARPGQPIAVLELGAGSGLFARLLLDAFRRRCACRGSDYYERLTYYVTDASPTMIRQWQASGMFAAHAGHVVPAVCDAQAPGELRCVDVTAIPLPPLSAVFVNYLLAQLPADIVRRTDQGFQHLCVRTCLTSDEASLRLRGNPTIAGVRALAEADDLGAAAELLRLLPLLEFETAYRDAGAAIPYVEEALAMEGAPPQAVVSHGAIRCALACARLLREDGFLLIRDMGTTTIPGAQARFPIRLAASVCVPVNLPLLSRLLSEQGWETVESPERENPQIETRLLCRRNGATVVRAEFAQQFRYGDWERADEAMDQARGLRTAGRSHEALEGCRRALRLAPRNWCLLADAAELAAMAGDAQARFELVEQALAINPWTSPLLWTIKGDCLRRLQRPEDARDAFATAQALDSGDLRAAAGLADCLLRLGDHAGALTQNARALAADPRGSYRGWLLNQQQQILASLAAWSNAEQEHLRKRDAAFSVTLRSE